jgi:hypothetical protein
MSTDVDKDSDEQVRRELARLPRELIPPQGLESRVVAALRDGGWLAAARPRSNAWRLGGSLAAGLALLLAGFWLGRQGDPRGHQPARPAIPVPSYVLMMREGTDFNRERWSDARLVDETAAWARHQLGVRHFVVGEKLDVGGWVVEPSQVAALSPTNVEDAPDGFFVVAAASDEEALGIARTCPFLRHGGRIEVRRIHPT